MLTQLIKVAREKRKLYEKVLKAKPLADSDSEEDTASWVAKNRELEEERRRAEERVYVFIFLISKLTDSVERCKDEKP